MSSPNALTLWSDKTYRLPVTELLFIASYCLLFTWLRDTVVLLETRMLLAACSPSLAPSGPCGPGASD